MGRKAKGDGKGSSKGVADRDGKRPVEGGSDDVESNYSPTGANIGLPKANLIRLMRKVIPRQVQISARAKQLTHDCTVEFVGFIATDAAEYARSQHRRTVSPEDVLLSLHRLGLEDYLEPMAAYLRRYRETQVNAAAAAAAGASSLSNLTDEELQLTEEEVQFLMSVLSASEE